MKSLQIVSEWKNNQNKSYRAIKSLSSRMQDRISKAPPIQMQAAWIDPTSWAYELWNLRELTSMLYCPPVQREIAPDVLFLNT